MLIDSQVVLGVLAKGRSSSERLNSTLARLAAVLTAADVRLYAAWVKSAENPADGPPRWAGKRGWRSARLGAADAPAGSPSRGAKKRRLQR